MSRRRPYDKDIGESSRPSRKLARTRRDYFLSPRPWRQLVLKEFEEQEQDDYVKAQEEDIDYRINSEEVEEEEEEEEEEEDYGIEDEEVEDNRIEDEDEEEDDAGDHYVAGEDEDLMPIPNVEWQWFGSMSPNSDIDPLTNAPTITDPGVLDCPICIQPLTSTVYECDLNGHIACSSCTPKIHTCPSCRGHFGSKRSRVVENILKSIISSCQNNIYGCKETMTYDKKREHERTCPHSRCYCPHSDCNFISSFRKLYRHFDIDHANTVNTSAASHFVYCHPFSIILSRNESFLVLQERNEGTLFILGNAPPKFNALDNNHVEDRQELGNVVRLNCLQPSFMEGAHYKLVAERKGNSISIESETKSWPKKVYDGPPSSSSSFLLIPSELFDSNDQIKIHLCIWPCGEHAPPSQYFQV